MKKFILFILLIFLVSCKTCPECKPIHVPKVVVPQIACNYPSSLTDIKKTNKKDITDQDLYVNEKGEIVITESFNRKSSEYINALEAAILLWESYEVCVENVIDTYEKLKDSLEAVK